MNNQTPKTRWATKEDLVIELARLRKLADISPIIRMQIYEIEAILKNVEGENIDRMGE